MSALTTLDANTFSTLSPGWLESLTSEELANLEAELEARVNAQLGLEEQTQVEIDAKCAQDSLYWLQSYTATENPLYQGQKLPFKAPFPKKSYFVPLFQRLTEKRRLFIPKTRDMLTSWCVMGDSAHKAQWQNWFVVAQADAEKKARQLLSYTRILYENQPEWLRKRHPLEGQSDYEMTWKGGGRVLAIPSGEHKIRLYHPTRYVMDEAAFLPEAEQCYDTAHPVAAQIIAISSAGPGWFGDQCSR